MNVEDFTQMDKKDILKDKSFSFAIRIVKVYQYLTDEKKEFVISKQLLRSGTSIGANIREAKNAESAKDFVHKLHIAQKECDESLYWAELLFASQYLTELEFQSISNDAIEILKILKSSILTVKQRIK
ncbi:four helix bundle protein [Chryseobacterium binzhouense]|uniref:four helix bundle protein n=1 Tax=Chryseobacterium binzhouense TaxID=2593646 RepID=UPI00289A5390|nr:four helix bundle protein [Chryseobacterium binzhouense]